MSTAVPPAVLAVLASALAVSAVLLGLPGRAHARPAVASSARARAPVQPRVLRLLVTAVASGMAVAVLLRPGVTTALAGLLVLASGAGVRLAARVRRLRRAAERQERVVEFGEALLGELRAGQPLVRSLERSAATCPEGQAIASAARLGADVPSALRRAASDPGAEALLQLAAAWQLCAGLGSGLAVATERVIEGARADQATSRLLQGEVASARATVRLLAALPVFVLLAAQGVGADPWHFLFETAPGVACLAGGVTLILAGVEWIDRIAEAALSGRL